VKSFHRIGATIAGLATTAIVAGVFVAQGYVAAVQATATSAATSAPTLGPEIVYVNPAPTPAVIQVQQTPPAVPPPVIHVIVPSGGEPETEGSDD
jgi:hypothetical protein